MTAAAFVLFSAGIVFAGKPGRILVPDNIRVSSVSSAYDHLPLVNGFRETDYWREAWASAYVPGRPQEHWVELSYAEPVAVEAVAIHWYVENNIPASSRSYSIQAWKNGAYTDIVEIADNPATPRNLHVFDRVETERIRIRQAPDGGPEIRPAVMWITEIEVYNYPKQEAEFGTTADEEQLRQVRQKVRDRTVGIYRRHARPHPRPRSGAVVGPLQEAGWRALELDRIGKRELEMCRILVVTGHHHMPNREQILEFVHNGGALLLLHYACGRSGGGSLFPELWTFEGMGQGELRIVNPAHPLAAGAQTRFLPTFGEHARLKAVGGDVVVRDEEGYDVVVAGRAGKGKVVAIGHFPGLSSGGTEWSEFRITQPEGAERELLLNSIQWLAEDTGQREKWRWSFALWRALRRERARTSPIFENITSEYGMDYYANAKGVVMADINRSGRLDVLATINTPVRWPWATIDKPFHNLLYINNGDWDFTETAVEAGVTEPPGIGAAFGDLNRNGHLDLFVSYLPEMGGQGRSSLFFGDGKGGFREVTDESGLSEVGESAFAIMADVNNNGHLDIYVVGYASDNGLYINRGDGTFENKTVEFGIEGLGSEGERGYGGNLAAAMADLDGSGYVDLVVFSRSIMRIYRNENGERFTEVTDYMGPGQSRIKERGRTLGLTLGDINNNGRLDIYIAGINALLRNDGELRFTEITAASGMEEHMTRHMHVYGAKLVDWNNSGYLDLYLASGSFDSFAFENNGDGTFTDVTAAIGLDADKVHGFNFGDLNGNGSLDFYATAWAQHPSVLLRNKLENGNSLTVNVKGRRTNPSGVGTQIRVYEEKPAGELVLKGYREVRSGGETMYAGALLQQHIGLGADAGAKTYTVKAFFPVSGERVTVSGLQPPASILIEEPVATESSE